MLFEIGLVAVGVGLGVTLAGGMAHRLYAWQRAERDEPDAAAWRRGYEAGKAAAFRQGLEHGKAIGRDETAQRLFGVPLEPGAAPMHRTWPPIEDGWSKAVRGDYIPPDPVPRHG